MHVRNLFFITVVVLLLSAWSYYYFDMPMLQWVTSHQDAHILMISKAVQFMFSFFLWSWLTPLVLIILWWRAGSLTAAFRRKSTQFFLGLLIAMFFCFIVKTSVGRYRPELFLTQHLYGFASGFVLDRARQSMPSDHTALIFSMIATITCFTRAKWLTVILVLLGLTAAMTRILYLKHYPSDVGVGIILGVWASYFAYWFCERFRRFK